MEAEDILLVDEDERSTPPELVDKANEAMGESIGVKSKKVYDKANSVFDEWCKKNKTEGYITANVLLAYCKYLYEEKKYKTTTIWSTISKIKKYNELFRKIQIDHTQITAYLKKIGQSDEGPKQSEIFTQHEMARFLKEANDEEFLHVKLASLIAIGGALRHCEIYNLLLSDIEVSTDENTMKVKIRVTKNGECKVFVIERMKEPWNVIANYKKHINRRAGSNNDKLFIRYDTKQNIGKNEIAKYPKYIALFLGYAASKADLYTGHCFRRTSATWAVQNDISAIDLQQLGGWKSFKVAEGYIAESDNHKRKISTKVFTESTAKKQKTETEEKENLSRDEKDKVVDIKGSGTPTINLPGSFTNCTINIIYK